MDKPDAPPSYPPPPPPKPRPKITLQIPPTSPVIPMTPKSNPMYLSPRFQPKPPGTPASHISDPHGHPYYNPFGHMYHSKASEFMFKQFEGFKDFTMNTAKSGLSAGEKSAFWFYNKLRILSKRWFTHFFLTLCLVLYSIMGAAMFMALEEWKEPEKCTGERGRKVYSITDLLLMCFANVFYCLCATIPVCIYLGSGVLIIVFLIGWCVMFCCC